MKGGEVALHDGGARRFCNKSSGDARARLFQKIGEVQHQE
jgi:hypothetical protein